MTLMINLSDYDYEEYEDEEVVGSEEGYPMFDDSDEESQWNEIQSRIVANRTRIESGLLHGAVAPPLVIQQQTPKTAPSVLTSFITNDGYIDHSLIAECAVRELHTLAIDNGGLLWTPIDGNGNTAILDEQLYQQTFHRPEPPTTTTTWTHASRASAVVRMDHIKLAKMLANYDKWTELFPSIVSKVIFLRVLFQRSSFNNPDGSLDLIYTELQATTPRFYARTFAFLRTCKQTDQSTWVVADVSIDGSRKVGYPCGCLIQGLGDGLSRVTWVEHLEFEETYLDYKLFTDLTNRGFAYGAERWTACLEQSCERIFYQNKTDVLLPLFLGQDGLFEKKLVMKLSQRMVRTFCLNIGPTETMRYLPGPRNLKVYTTVRQSPYHDDPKEMVVISATTFGLPHPPESVFQILADEHTFHEWDPSRSIAQFKKPTCYRTGADSRNRICVFKTLSWISDEVVLQEASVNRSGSLLVWSLLKSEGFERVRTGKDPSSRPALIELAGLAISANSQRKTTSRISNIGDGSIVTLGVQQEACDIKGLEPKTVELVQEYIKMAVKRIEAVLKKKTGPSAEGTNKGKGIFSM